MQKSKLEHYEDVLRVLVDKSLTVDSIAYECNMDCVALRQRLTFLMKNGLVEEEDCQKKTVYALTRRGLAIFKTLAITRRLEKLQTTIKMIDEALQAIPALSEYKEEKTKRKRRNENY
jgi:predicted transcriptional regulator